VGKFKPDWQETLIPFHVKIILWRLIRDNPTYKSWQRAMELHDWGKRDDEFIACSRHTYRALSRELEKMPRKVIKTQLPEDLQIYISQIREDIDIDEIKSTEESGHVQDYHLSDIRDFLKDCISRLDQGADPNTTTIIENGLFPHLLEHCPSISNKYEILGARAKDYEEVLIPIYKKLAEPFIGELEAKLEISLPDSKDFSVTTRAIGPSGESLDPRDFTRTPMEAQDIVADAFIRRRDPCSDILAYCNNIQNNTQLVEECSRIYRRIMEATPELDSCRQKAKKAHARFWLARRDLLDGFHDSYITGEYLKHRCVLCSRELP